MAFQEKTRVMIVETNEFIRHGLSSFLGNKPEWEIVGHFADASDLIGRVLQPAPDILLLDVDAVIASDLSLEKVVHTVKATSEETKIVFWADRENPELLAEIIQSDADGYLSKDNRLQDLLSFFQQIHRGRKLLSCRLPLSTLAPYLKADPSQASVNTLLTRRERQVLTLLSKGRSNSGIAEDLGIQVSTASVHVSNIIAKLQADNRTHAVLRAAELGFIEVETVGAE